MNNVKSEYEKAEEMREADGIARHGIEGWRLLTGNLEGTIEGLNREVDYGRREVQWQKDLVEEGKAKLRELRKKIKELRGELKHLRTRRWKTSKPLTRKTSSGSRKARPRKSAATGR